MARLLKYLQLAAFLIVFGFLGIMEIKLAQKFDLWPIDKLKPYEKNARTHSPEQIEKIAASMTEFGFTNPILVDSLEGIIAGHGRLEAAKKLGLSEVPVIILDHLSPAQRRAYIIADNKLAELAGWDEELLAAEIQALKLDEFDIGLLGFTDDELAGLLPDPDAISAAGGGSDDYVPEILDDSKVTKGEIYILGSHFLMCGDSTDINDLAKLMGNSQADLALCSLGFTDPPWNVNYGDKGREILNDNQSADEWDFFLTKTAESLFSATNAGAPIYVVMGSQEWPAVDQRLRDAGFHWSSTIVWVKDKFVLTRKDYHSQFEPIWYGWNSGAPRLRPLEDRTQSDVWHFPRPQSSDIHPMMKPIELIERAVNNSSKKGDLVVDLFGGSGSTLIACEKAGRSARLMELDPRYCQAIIDRWESFSGKKASRSDGKPWSEIKDG